LILGGGLIILRGFSTLIVSSSLITASGFPSAPEEFSPCYESLGFKSGTGGSIILKTILLTFDAYSNLEVTGGKICGKQKKIPTIIQKF
jgi:hypothetical protein